MTINNFMLREIYCQQLHNWILDILIYLIAALKYVFISFKRIVSALFTFMAMKYKGRGTDICIYTHTNSALKIFYYWQLSIALQYFNRILANMVKFHLLANKILSLHIFYFCLYFNRMVFGLYLPNSMKVQTVKYLV